MLQALSAALVDLLFPPKCLTCGALAEPFCLECRAALEPAERLTPPPEVDAIRSAGYHEGPLRRAVLRLKFERKVALVPPLAALLAEELDAVRDRWAPDALAPVPLHWARRLERGFNQSELLAAEFGKQSGLPVLPVLRRVRSTGQQIGRSAEERAQSIRNAFTAQPDLVRGRRLVLIDDVWTTGATVAECAAVLRQAGAAAVFVLTVTHDR